MTTPLQRRKTDTETPDTSSPDSRSLEDNKKMSTFHVKRGTIQRFVVAMIVLLVVIKLFQILFSSGQPPAEPLMSSAQWPHRQNPQGIDEPRLQKLFEKLEDSPDVDVINPVDSPVAKMEIKETVHELKVKLKGVYKSTGSLKFQNRQFTLDGKPFRILSGAMHYFRVLPEYWEDRMRKMLAAGLNTLETYVSWDLHEDSPGKFDFDGMLDIRTYIRLAQKLGLYVILRPGPYICSEWDFGGLPPWLLSDPHMKVRSNYKGYMDAVERYFGKLIPLVADLQHMRGGPIIAVQVENEFGSYSSEVEHLLFLKKLMLKHGITEMLFTSDGFVNKDGDVGFNIAPFHDEALPTANFKEFRLGTQLFDVIKSMCSDFPLVVMEFWSGWFDHWDKPHATSTAEVLARDLQQILQAGASVNFYMFHGGTNFGFMAGANWFNETGYKSDVTSYDYISPLSEAGDITPKFEICRRLILKHVLKPQGVTSLPDPPANSRKAAYGQVLIQSYLPLDSLATPIKAISKTSPVPMEMLELASGSGQNYGYILYRTFIKRGSKLKFSSPGHDRVQVILNGIQVGLFTWYSSTWSTPLPESKQADENILDILVENHGRVNYVKRGFNKFNEERKGLDGDVLLDGAPIRDWKIYPMQFKQQYFDKLEASHEWKPFITMDWEGKVGAFQTSLNINGTPADTFLSMAGWNKGIVLINGFNLGRYWKTGPQKTLFVPAPILKTGKNTIIIFEHHKASHSIEFQDTHEIGG